MEQALCLLDSSSLATANVNDRSEAACPSSLGASTMIAYALLLIHLAASVLRNTELSSCLARQLDCPRFRPHLPTAACAAAESSGLQARAQERIRETARARTAGMAGAAAGRMPGLYRHGGAGWLMLPMLCGMIVCPAPLTRLSIRETRLAPWLLWAG
jgi:hypothetical protein